MLPVNIQSILLLTCYFSSADDKEIRPLSNKEWGKFAMWLKDHQLRPENLLKGDLDTQLKGWSDKKITPERLQKLLNRGSAMAFALEKWTRAGLWIMTRSDADYPKRLKLRLASDAPAVLFGCGNRDLLNRGGIAVVGSRNTSDDDLAYSQSLGMKAANEGLNIVSGGARGVDEAAMLGTLEAEGMAIGVLANDLLRSATSAKYRKHLRSNNLVLISPFYPEAGFNAGNAMQRNKYIYCLADTAIAVHSGTKGGTWEGVQENIKHGWIPIWIKKSKDPAAGNEQLVRKGANYLPDALSDFALHQLASTSTDHKAGQAADMFTQAATSASSHSIATSALTEPTEPNDGAAVREAEPKNLLPDVSFYALFLTKVGLLCKGSPKTVDELFELMDLQKTQLNIWLKRAVEQGQLKKLNKPVRYELQDQRQNDMFEGD